MNIVEEVCLRQGKNVTLSYVDPMNPYQVYEREITSDKTIWFKVTEIEVFTYKWRGRRKTRYTYNYLYPFPEYNGQKIQFMSWVK
jgi:hypothetical protein